MKIIVSHDIDHLSVREHFRDTVLPRFIIRSLLEFVVGAISPHEMLSRMRDLRRNKWQNIEEIMAFDREEGIPSTFFIGVSQGRGLAYARPDAKYWAGRIRRQRFNLGVHGIAFDDQRSMHMEHTAFKAITGSETFGVRLHYLSQSAETQTFLHQAGYLFDASTYEMRSPYRHSGLWEFPIHIMDGRVFQNRKILGKPGLDTVQQTTVRIIQDASANGIRYFSLLFHDRYFCPSFGAMQAWYRWVIRYLKEKGYGFIDYKGAIHELEDPQGADSA